MTRHGAIIEELGGRARVANLFGLNIDTVEKWYVRGIPSRHWHRVTALRPDLTPDLLDRTKPWGAQAKKRRRRR